MPKTKTPKAASEPVVTTLGRFTLPAASLREGLARLKPAVGFRSNFAVLASIAVTRHNGETILTAENYTVRARHLIPSAFPAASNPLAARLLAARSERENCAFTVPFADLSAVAKDCDRDASLQITVDSLFRVGIAYPVNGAEFRQTLAGGDPGHFPAPRDEFPANAPAMLCTASVRQSFFAAYEAASTDETRYILNGVALDPTRDHHTAVATDGRQLIAANSVTFPFDRLVVIPRDPIFDLKLLRETDWQLEVSCPPPAKHGADKIRAALAKIDGKMQKLAPEDEDADPLSDDQAARYESLQRRRALIEAYQAQNDVDLVRITAGGTTYQFRAIEGNYPNYRQAIPDEENYQITVPLDAGTRKHLVQTLPHLPTERSDRNESVLLTIDRASVSIATGDTIIPVPTAAPRWKGKPNTLRISVNRQFLLRAARLGFTEVNFISPMDPLVFHRDGSRMVAMPLRIEA